MQAIRAVKQNEGTITKERAHTLWTDPVACISALCHQLHPNQLAVLYSGLQPAAVETTCSSAIYFYFYSLLRQAVVSFNRWGKAEGEKGALATGRGRGVAGCMLHGSHTPGWAFHSYFLQTAGWRVKAVALYTILLPHHTTITATCLCSCVH
jgi:hypothetical protein